MYCCCFACCVAPRVFQAPEAPAAREAKRPHFVRRLASKPARALRSLRRPPHQWGRVADVCLSFAPRSPARPCRHPQAPQPGPSPTTRPREREKTRPAPLHQRPQAKKFAQHRQNCPKSALFRLQGELFRGLFQNPLLLGEFFRADGCHSRLTTPANHLT